LRLAKRTTARHAGCVTSSAQGATGSPDGLPSSSRAGGRFQRNDTLLAIARLAPAVLFIVLLVGVPFGLALYYSLHDGTTGGTAPRWVGLGHFADLLGDATLPTALRHGFVFTLSSLIAVLILATIQGGLLMRRFRGKWLVRFLVLLP